MALIQHLRWMKTPSPPPGGTLGRSAAQTTFGRHRGPCPRQGRDAVGSLQPHQLLPRSGRRDGEHRGAIQILLLAVLRLSPLSSAPPARSKSPFTSDCSFLLSQSPAGRGVLVAGGSTLGQKEREKLGINQRSARAAPPSASTPGRTTRGDAGVTLRAGCFPRDPGTAWGGRTL